MLARLMQRRGARSAADADGVNAALEYVRVVVFELIDTLATEIGHAYIDGLRDSALEDMFVTTPGARAEERSIDALTTAAEHLIAALSSLDVHP